MDKFMINSLAEQNQDPEASVMDKFMIHSLAEGPEAFAMD